MANGPELRVRLQALAALVPKLEADGAEAAFGAWVASREQQPGVWTMPYVEYGDLEREFRAATTGWVRPDIDWTTWAATAAGQALQRDPALIAGASPEELAHLLTTIVRGDRFHEGLLLSALTRGVLLAVARRAAVLAADPLGGRSINHGPPIAALFTCDLCGKHASTITLVPPGGRNPLAPKPGEHGFDPGRSDILATATQLALDGPVQISHGFLPSMDVDLDRIVRALTSGDPVVLYRLNDEYAPFWCPSCARIYCPDHWIVWQEMDEGFYDCTRGRCPEGHERILDD